jgi:hypothetical protein
VSAHAKHSTAVRRHLAGGVQTGHCTLRCARMRAVELAVAFTVPVARPIRPQPAAPEPPAFAPAGLIVSRSASNTEAAVCAEAARSAGFSAAVIKSRDREILDAVADLG